ncbi:reverse transcriptase domain-containing protein [Tanacetum coccineum]|uniref:Reverse transcriptase domain-containing protein n=1 Tax=Tanacetum coccineum TaxID=301880 RepID=A0ABQ4WBB0_9ASTR
MSFRQRDEKKVKSDQKCFRCGDLNHLIGDCPKPSRNKDQKAFIGGSWSDSENDAEDKTNDETCLMDQSSNECMSTRSSTRNLFPPLEDPERGGLPVPDLRTMEELCQPTLNGRGGPIAPINIQATNFGLKNDMIQQVQNSCQFYGLPGDNANKKLLSTLYGDGVRSAMKSPHSVTVDESLFEAWERYKLSIDCCPNHNMLPVTQIDTFYNGLTLRHRDTINAAAGETFMKRRPEECYDLIENMIAHHNDWDTSIQRSESSSSITSFDQEIEALKAEMAEINKNLMKMLQTNQQVKAVTPSCETCGGPHAYNDCSATVGQT